jgi:hypothetical protein
MDDDDKVKALAAYCALLGGASLPAELVARATVEDLRVARRSLVQDITSTSMTSIDVDWRFQWRLNQRTPSRLRALFGEPRLVAVIKDRQREEAAAKREAELDAGFEIDIPLDGPIIEALREKGFLVGDVLDPVSVGEAVASALRFVTGLPPAGFEGAASLLERSRRSQPRI